LAPKTRPIGINNSGDIVGWFLFYNGGSHAFLYQDGAYTTIDPPGSTDAIPAAINNGGQVIGIYRALDGSGHGFLYSAGTYTMIDFPGGIDTQPLIIQDSGQIAGYYSDGSGLHGFLATPANPAD
jgi:probable HAF family extracellular repeat protein